MYPGYGSVATNPEGRDTARDVSSAGQTDRQEAVATTNGAPRGDGGGAGKTRNTVHYLLSSVTGEIKPQYLDSTKIIDDTWLEKEECEPLNDDEEGRTPKQQNKAPSSLLRYSKIRYGSKSSSSDAGHKERQSPPPAPQMSEQNRGMSFSTYASIVTFASGSEDDEDAERT
eukprot:CAMPEP_0113532774 /NCGR_PEP_ID=MMETSP0015_2-20120614/4241_1 /TAXON_ID=2838 /ORGANISM="Odontella" /LENGTH=170 /DNA_ID=CAMNT_0000431763 /DNA_START=166 /DNA_END=674 /DNA_ORIENTATION=- /assembly_acc=CAM_ASM_000160